MGECSSLPQPGPAGEGERQWRWGYVPKKGTGKKGNLKSRNWEGIPTARLWGRRWEGLASPAHGWGEGEESVEGGR